MEKLMNLGAGARRRRWPILLILFIFFAIGSAVNAHEPEWYRREVAAMENVARLLDAPVPYTRMGEGFGKSYHVDAVFLPPVRIDRRMAQALAEEIRALPRGTIVVCQYVPNQRSAIDELNRALAGHAIATHDAGSWNASREEFQRATYVAGIHGPDRHR